MAFCRLVLVLGVVMALFDHGMSRGFNGNYNQAALIQTASRITKTNTNDEPIVVRSKRSAAFHGSGKQQTNVGIDDADCNDLDGDMPSVRFRRVPESPDLAQAIDNKIEQDNFEADDTEVNKRSKAASSYISRFLSKYKQQDSDDADENDNDDGANEDTESEDNDILKRIELLLGIKSGDDDLKRSGSDASADKAEYYSTAEMAEMLKAAFSTALEKSRVKRQTVEEVEHVDDHLRRAEMKNLFVAGHYAKLGENAGAVPGGFAHIAEENASVKKRGVRRRRKRSGAKGYKALMMDHGRTVNDIVHV